MFYVVYRQVIKIQIFTEKNDIKHLPINGSKSIKDGEQDAP